MRSAQPDSVTTAGTDGAPASAPNWWRTVAAATGTLLGLLPHLLHHVGLLAGTALIAGVGGTLLFGALGLLATVPLLIRLRRRFASWWAPTIALALFAVMFALSTFVLGPAFRGDTTSPPGSGPATDASVMDGHTSHHRS